MKTDQMKRHQMKGMSLIELMIAVAVVGIIAAVAVPFYSDYVGTSREATMTQNIQTIRLFEDNYKLENRAFIEGTYNPAAPTAGLASASSLGWTPRAENDAITYVVTCQTPTADADDDECTRASGYYVTATDADGNSVCVEFEGASCP